MPPKKVQKKKATLKKPSKKAAPKAVPAKKPISKTAKPIVLKIISRKGKEPCCTELKTGQGYTVPLGFSSLKGHEPEVVKKVVAKPMETQTESIPFSQKQARVESMETQTDTIPLGKTMETQTEPPQTRSIGVNISSGPPVTIVTGKTIAVPTALLPPPKVITTPIKRTPSLRMPSELPIEPLPAAPRRYKRIRRNSRADLELRYEAIQGAPYTGPKMSNAEFKNRVEYLESTKKK